MIFYDEVTREIIKARFAFLIKDGSGKTVWDGFDEPKPELDNKYRVTYMEYMFDGFVPKSLGWYAKIIYDNASEALSLTEQMKKGGVAQWPEDILFPAYSYNKR